MSDLGRFAACGLVGLKTDGSIADANEKFLEWVGLPIGEVVGRPLSSFVDEPQLGNEQGVPTVNSSTVALRRGDGSTLPVLVNWSHRGDDVFVALFDATQRLEFENRMLAAHALTERNERRLGLLLSAAVTFAAADSPDAVAQLLAETVRSSYAATDSAVFLVDEEYRIRLAAGHNPFGELPDGEELAQAAIGLRDVLTVSSVSAASALPESVRRNLRAADVEGLLVAPIFDDDAQFGIFAAFFRAVRPFDEQAVPLAEALARQAAQVISRLRLQAQLERLALHDATTGLPNRRLLEERIDGYARKAGALLAVIFLDIDGFKAVNDQLGHTAGDDLLRTVGARMQAVVRDPDTVARFGGDEFVAVCEVNDEADAQAIAERLRDAVSQPYSDLPEHVRIGVSVGVAISDTGAVPLLADQLVRIADHAMYEAKTSGGNRVVLQPLGA